MAGSGGRGKIAAAGERKCFQLASATSWYMVTTIAWSGGIQPGFVPVIEPGIPGADGEKTIDELE